MWQRQQQGPSRLRAVLTAGLVEQAHRSVAPTAGLVEQALSVAPTGQLNPWAAQHQRDLLAACKGGNRQEIQDIREIQAIQELKTKLDVAVDELKDQQSETEQCEKLTTLVLQLPRLLQDVERKNLTPETLKLLQDIDQWIEDNNANEDLDDEDEEIYQALEALPDDPNEPKRQQSADL